MPRGAEQRNAVQPTADAFTSRSSADAEQPRDARVVSPLRSGSAVKEQAARVVAFPGRKEPQREQAVAPTPKVSKEIVSENVIVRPHASDADSPTHTRADFFDILDRTDGQVAGDIMLVSSLEDASVGELAYSVAEDKRGRGLATEAVRAVTDHAFDNGFTEVVGEVHKDNAASMRVLHHNGFRLRKGSEKDGFVKFTREKKAQIIDPEKFVALTTQYTAELYSHALRILDNPHDAEDVVQDTLLKAWKHRGQYTPDTNFRAWLHRICTNTALDEKRREQRGGGKYPVTHDGEIPEPAAYATPGIVRDELQVGAALQDHLVEEGVNPDFAQAVALREMGGLSYDEIAKVQKTTLGTARTRISRGRKGLGEVRQRRIDDIVSFASTKVHSVRDTKPQT